MSEVTGRHVRLDNGHFEGVIFRDCVLHYGGGDFHCVNCDFGQGCFWLFDGAAGRTLRLLSLMYQDGAKDLVENLFGQVRSGYFETREEIKGGPN